MTFGRSNVVHAQSLTAVLLTVIALHTRSATAALPPPMVDHRSTDEKFLAGLTELKLYRLAEDFCRRELASTRIAEDRRARLTIELARALAGRALDSPRDVRQKLWQQAFELLANYGKSNPASGFLPLVEYRRVVMQLEQAQIVRQEAALAGGDGKSLEAARSGLRKAIKEILALEESLTTLSRSPHVAKDPTKGLTASQVIALRDHTRYQLGRAYRNQAQTFPSDKPDRVNAVDQAVEVFVELAEMDSNAAFVWNSRIELVRCARLKGDFVSGEAATRKLLTLELPPKTQQALEAEHLRMLASQPDRIDQAQRLVAEARKAGRVQSGDLALAQLEVQVAAWRRAKKLMDAAQAAKELEAASATLAAIRAEFPGYWALRAGRLLDLTDQAAILVRSAATYFHQGRFDEAIAAYDRAALQAKNDPARQFQYSLVAAKIEHQRGRWQDAISRYRKLSLAAPEQSAAAQTHLTAVQLAASKLKKGDKLYEQLLVEHLAKWPQGSSAAEALVRQGELEEVRGRWSLAIGAYRAVSPSSPQYLQAVLGVARCVKPVISAAIAKGQRTDELAQDAAKYFENVVRGGASDWPARFNRVAQEATLAAARIRLQNVPGSETKVEELLNTAMSRAAEPTPNWRQEAQMLSVVALAMQGKANEARKLIGHVTSGSPAQLLTLLTGIHQASEASSGAQATAMAQLQLDVIQLLEPHEAKLKADQRQALARRKADALAAAGRRDDALALYDKLAAANPKDGRLQEAHAQLLLEGDNRSQLELALARWRSIERRSKPRSARWLRAKYALALAHLKLGDKAQAKKVIALARVLSPELGGASMKQQFDALEQQLK